MEPFSLDCHAFKNDFYNAHGGTTKTTQHQLNVDSGRIWKFRLVLVAVDGRMNDGRATSQ